MIHPQPKSPKPVRDPGYRKWLRSYPCSVIGKQSDSPCWSPDIVTIRSTGGLLYFQEWFASDPAHGHKAISGRIKIGDDTCIPLCRRHHEEQELNMDAFDRKYGIDRHALAATLYRQYQEEKGMGKPSSADLIENFVLTPEMREWAAKKAPSVNLDEEMEAWQDRCRRDDYRSSGGRGAKITDAAASFRTACRNAELWGTYRKQPSQYGRRAAELSRKDE